MHQPDDATPEQATSDAEHEVAPEPEPAPLLTLRDGLPPVVDDDATLAEAVEAFRGGGGPVAIDAERASGYRYSARAYLIQLRREGSGTVLIDPTAFEDLSALDEALEGVEWILHAATQDLPCLTALGLRPSALFDTELAGRLLGYPRVGLATLVETIVGRRLRKEHSAADWSTRPLPEAWLEYAALDVEVLVELREALGAELEDTGKAEWARQEFAHLIAAPPPGPRQDPWRRTSGMHRARGRRAVAAVRELWQTRDAIASQRDMTPGRIIPDSAIIEAANHLPRDKASLLGLKGFRGRGAERYSRQWLEALQAARSLPESELPPLAARYDGPPPPRSWADKDPLAAARLALARSDLGQLASDLNLPVENLLTPDYVRRLIWDAPEAASEPELVDLVTDRLGALGARAWQVALTARPLAHAIAEAQVSTDETGTG
ncbi:MAG TPA: HRDC domain-containing protein [Nocardioidaceae bacterium]|nr:HRDC domain-containing protein [Nocardioidaceae bacterium]